MSYFKAEKECCEMGMQLVSVNSVAEDKCLKDNSKIFCGFEDRKTIV